MAILASEASVPVTLYLVPQANDTEQAIERRELWVYSIEAGEDGLHVEQDHVFRAYPDHRVDIVYGPEEGACYLLEGHGHPAPPADAVAFAEFWSEVSGTQTVLYQPDS